MARAMTHNQHSVESSRGAAGSTPRGGFRRDGVPDQGTPAQAPNMSGVKVSSKSLANKRWRERHAEHDAARKRAWYEANKGRLLEKARVRALKYWHANKESRKELRKAQRRAWKLKHPELHRARRRMEEHRRRAKAGGYRVEYVSPSIIGRLIQLQGERCVYCRIFRPAQWHVDHIMPLALGGAHEEANFQMLCADCNVEKGALHPVEFARAREFSFYGGA